MTRTAGRLCTLLTSSGRSTGVGASIATPEPGDNGRLSSSEVTFCEGMVGSCSSWAGTSSTGTWRSPWAEVSSVSAVAWVSLQWSSWSTIDIWYPRVGVGKSRVEAGPIMREDQHNDYSATRDYWEPLTRTRSKKGNPRTNGEGAMISSFKLLPFRVNGIRAESGIGFPRIIQFIRMSGFPTSVRWKTKMRLSAVHFYFCFPGSS